ncbi:DUF952 domain-containing protein [Cellulomonas sp. KRMCY2]|uniref:DUF952 domain-containing protein n=1 Tax=Cellulomonas sp. KRMCY2 TaxID=1304865 RepID=UPI00045E805F|nr:DUF952 domain-containing protein [Cellulomonas sp. KRMCY2]
MSTVLHLAERTDWTAAVRSGSYDRSTRGASVAQTGFVHASTADQMPRVADVVHAGVPPEDLVLLVVDLEALALAGVPVRWENLDGGDETFPHIYAPLPTSAVVAALPVTLDDAGHVRLPDLGGLDVIDRRLAAPSEPPPGGE